jgi:AraC-like DNA-binding protein
MVSIVHRTFSDPNSYAQTIRGAHTCDLTVSERGVFDAQLTIIDLDRVWLQRGRDNLARALHIGVEEARRSVVFLADPQAPPHIQSGKEFGADDVASFGQASSHFQRTFGPIDWAAMSLPAGCLEDAARTIAGRDIPDPSTSLWMKPFGEHLNRLRDLHHAVDRMARFDEKALDHPEVQRALEHSLIVAMVACVTAGTDRDRGYGWHRHQQVMRLFKEWLETNLGRAVYLPEICAALDVSAPTLRRCCEEHLGMSPMRYLRLRRMNLVRQQLQQRDSSTSVTAAAMNFGFWHLGRFAAEYHSLFGEMPSVTLAQPPIS